MRKQASILLCLLVLMTTLTGCLGQDQQTQEEDSSTLGSTDQSLYQGLIQRGEDDDALLFDEKLTIETQEADREREQAELKEYYEELDEQREGDLVELNELLSGGEVTLKDCEKFEDAEIKDVCVMSIEMLEEN